MKGKILSLLCALTVGAGLSTAVSAETVYKWVDEKGGTHFGEKPPTGSASERIRLNAPGRSSDPAPAAKPAAPAASDAKPADKEAAAKDAAAEKTREEVMKKNCEAYAANLKILNESGQVRETGADGKVKMLTPDEKAARMENARKFIEEYCKP